VTRNREALEVAVEAARVAGEILRSGGGKEKEARVKGHPRDLVTLFDRYAEEAIVEMLRRTFPEDGVLAEEGTVARGTSGAVWVIDPLDGTVNFVRDLPHAAVSIARVTDGRAEVACIHDPWRDETFTALAGGRAHLRGNPIRVSGQSSLDGALLAIGYSFRPERALILHARVLPLLRSGSGVRTTGSAALDLAYVAAARFDAALYLALHPWDVAAGTLLVAEAGGKVSDLLGRPLASPQEGVLATNGLLHEAVLAAFSTSEEAA